MVVGSDTPPESGAKTGEAGEAEDNVKSKIMGSDCLEEEVEGGRIDTDEEASAGKEDGQASKEIEAAGEIGEGEP